jgi:nicotinamidase-related amidase
MANTHMTIALSCQFVWIDIQQKLVSAMPSEAYLAMRQQCEVLAKAAKLLEIPTLITEQYPKGLGHTVPELASLLTTTAVVEKTAFSCMAEPKFARLLTSDKPQVVLAGMEAHICVLQTALDMHVAGKQVFVLEDAVISRNPQNKANALARLRHAGVIVSNTESVLFECLGKAEGDAFKQISKLIR